VVDNHALTVVITSPASGSRFRNSVTVTALVSEPVTQVAFSVGSQSVTVTSAPYQATLDLTPVPEGNVTLTVSAAAAGGERASATEPIVIARTPPPAPDPSRIAAEQSDPQFSLVLGQSGAVHAGLRVQATNTTGSSGATGATTAALDGSF